MVAVRRSCIAGSVMVLALATAATAATLTVTKTGSGSGIVSGGPIMCGGACTAELASGESVTLDYTMDSSYAELLGWGGACAPAENRTTCTVTAGGLMQAIYGDNIPVLVTTGYYRDGVCRAYGGLSTHIYFDSLQLAYDVVKAGAASPPIECVTGQYLTIGAIDSATEISGGWGSFAPNAEPAEGATSTIAGELIVSTGSLVISGKGGITLACGYQTVTGPYTVTDTPLIIGDNPCVFGLIIQ